MIALLEAFLLIFIVAPLSATVLICLHKWGAIEYLQMWRKRLYPLPIDCDFCLLFWLSVIILSAILITTHQIFTSNIYYLVVPLASTSIAKAIYENSKIR